MTEAYIKSMRAAKKNTEIDKFNALARTWWDPHGPMAPLHWMNPPRLQFIKNNLPKNLPAKKLAGLDIGCGAGLLTEPLARQGHRMTAVDGAADAITVARNRAEAEGLAIDYVLGEVPHARLKNNTYDFVTALEIIEHVDNPRVFLQAAIACLKPGGTLFLSTLNRTLKSRLVAILGAEYVLRILPLGTHDYDKFIKPSELVAMLQDEGMTVTALNGLTFSPFKKSFALCENDLDINYILAAEKCV